MSDLESSFVFFRIGSQASIFSRPNLMGEAVLMHLRCCGSPVVSWRTESWRADAKRGTAIGVAIPFLSNTLQRALME